MTINDGSITVSHSFAVVVANVLPVVSAGNDVTLAGPAFTGAGAFTDPGADAWTATVNYGDNTGTQILALTGKSFTLNHTYAQKGTYTVTVTVNDGTGSGSDSVLVTYPGNNQAPAVTLPSTASINEGGTYTASGSFTDSDTNTWTATVDYGLGAGPQPLTLTNKTFSLSNVYPNNGSFTVTVAVSDGIATSTATVFGHCRQRRSHDLFEAPDATVVVGQTFTRSGSFTDPGADTWTATVNYGDGTGANPLTLAAAKTFALTSHALYANRNVSSSR